MTTTQTPAPTFTVTMPWYFYADTAIEYVCRFSQDDKIPARFYGPFDHQYAASIAYREWKLEQMEHDEEYESD